jgi:hypothetical protein
MNKKHLFVFVLTAVLFGLVYTIERTARPVNERQPGTAASAVEPGHEGHNHAPGEGH